jgi:coatomer subunit beta
MVDACVILNDIHIDIMDYIKPVYCNEAQVRAMVSLKVPIFPIIVS